MEPPIEVLRENEKSTGPNLWVQLCAFCNKRSKSIFVDRGSAYYSPWIPHSDCALGHSNLSDDIPEPVAAYHVFQNIIGGITPFFGPGIYFYSAGLTDYHARFLPWGWAHASEAAI